MLQNNFYYSTLRLVGSKNLLLNALKINTLLLTAYNYYFLFFVNATDINQTYSFKKNCALKFEYCYNIIHIEYIYV